MNERRGHLAMIVYSMGILLGIPPLYTIIANGY